MLEYRYRTGRHPIRAFADNRRKKAGILMKSVWVINGPNLNLLGKREPEIYGQKTLADLESLLRKKAEEHGIRLVFRQSNHEGQIIDWLHEANGDKTALGIILNPGAFTHYSYAIFDAVKAIEVPVFEVHLTNIFAREPFRSRSVIAPAAAGHICGAGFYGYELALQFFIDLNKRRGENGKAGEDPEKNQ